MLFIAQSIFSFFLPELTYASNIFLVGGLLSLLLGFLFPYQPKRRLESIYFYDNSIDSPIFPFESLRYRPPWLEGRYYWVYRHLYYWVWEVTLHRTLAVPRLQPDWERIELWVNAETGKLDWIVSDFHFRELWYKAECQNVFVHWDFVFHTVIVTRGSKEMERIEDMIELSRRPRIFVSPRDYKKLVELENQRRLLAKKRRNFYIEKHDEKVLARYFSNKVLADVCSKMPWDYIRYFGSEEI